MEEATNRPKGKRKKGKRAARRSPTINEERKLSLDAPAGSRFKGYDDFVVQDLRPEGRVIRYRRERRLTPEGKLLVAPLPSGLRGHFGPELVCFILLRHHQGQVTTDRIVQLLNSLGLSISKRQVLRLLSDYVDVPVCRSEAPKIRHGGPDLRRDAAAGGENAEALAYMRERHLGASMIGLLDEHAQKVFADETSWSDHLDWLGISELPHAGSGVHPDPIKIATEGALWGSIQAHGLLRNTVISLPAGAKLRGSGPSCRIFAAMRLQTGMSPTAPVSSASTTTPTGRPI